MKYKIIQTTLEYLSPKELEHYLRTMAILDCIMCPGQEEWLRLVHKYEKGTAFYLSNGAGDEMDIFFEENGVWIKGFDHENELNQFAAEEWNEDFFIETYQNMPKNFLEIFEDQEERERMTFSMWYDVKAKCWHQNIVETNDGGKSYLLGFICQDADAWLEWAEDYYEAKLSGPIVKKVYQGDLLTEEEIHVLNPECDAKSVLGEIRNMNKK